MTPHIKLQYSVLAIALAAVYPLQAFAAPSAGVAQFIAGDVNIRRADGETGTLIRGKDIESGEAILTGASGRAQVRFTDGGLISLQPNTEFKVVNYVDKADPKEDRFLVDLLRGSMRAITGLIGKRNRQNYKVTTTTATIGIRGSGFNAGYNSDGSLSVTTELDAIEVCNSGGCVGLTAGESARVISSTDAPVRTNVRANVPTPSPGRDPVTVSDKVNDQGQSTIIAEKSPSTPTPASQTNDGTFTDMTVIARYHTQPVTADPAGAFNGPVASTSVVLSGGKVTEFESLGNVFKPTINTVDGSFGSVANKDFIGWGHWSTGTKNGSTNLDLIHYLVGQATAVLPTTVGVATYTLIGGSTPTLSTGATGTLLSTSNLSVNFDTSGPGPTVNMNIHTSLGNLTDYAYFSSSTFTSSFGGMKGMFTGPNANRAGIVYNGVVSPSPLVMLSGTAIFQAP